MNPIRSRAPTLPRATGGRRRFGPTLSERGEGLLGGRPAGAGRTRRASAVNFESRVPKSQGGLDARRPGFDCSLAVPRILTPNKLRRRYQQMAPRTQLFQQLEFSEELLEAAIAVG